MFEIFHTFLTQPLLNVLIWLYNVLPGDSLGLAIIALTVLIRFALLPSFSKSLKSQKQLQELQPKLEELREKHKGDKEAEAKAVMEFYRENKISPFSSCLPLLLQLPILFALYRVFLTGLNGDISGELYGFVMDPGEINRMFLGIDLGEKNIFLAIIAGGLQYVQSKMLTPQKKSASGTASAITNQMLYFMPIFTVFIAATLPSGLAIYWVTTTLFAIAQQYFILKSAPKADITT